MTEHVCEWTPDILGARCNCGRALSKDGLIKRANEYETLKRATEEFGVDEAKTLLLFIDWAVNAIAECDVDEGKIGDWNFASIRAYADILEGK